MNRSFMFPAIMAVGSACTFDATGLSVPSQQPSYFGDESDSTDPFPTTGSDTPTETDEAPSSGAPTTGPGSSGEGDTPAVSSSSDEDTGSLLAVCGDGMITGDEECDDGPGENADDRLCTANCLVARCGDGHLQAANGEECDAGGANVGDPGYVECSTDCKKGPYCGDGEVQIEFGEECEPLEVERGSGTCQASCVHEARVLFVTSAPTDGDLGGLAGADQLCNELSGASPLTGTYRAWLLLAGQSITDRFPEFFGMQPPPINFVNVGGDVLAKNMADLILTGPAYPIVHDEQGEARPGLFVWTNVMSSGDNGSDCDQWSGVEGVARVGHDGYLPDVGPLAEAWHEGRKWTDIGVDLFCDDQSPHLYCVQVAD